MPRLKYLIGMLGVSLVVVASMSSQATAATAGWMVNGTQLTGTAAVAETAAVDQEFEATVGPIQVKCASKKLKVIKAIIAAVLRFIADAIENSECTGNAVCPLAESMGGKITTLPTETILTLDGALAVKGRILATNSSKTFATIAFGGAECSFAGVNRVSGSQAVLMPTGQDERTSQLTVFVSEGEGLKLASTAVTVKGASLTNLASGLPFSFL